MDAIEYKPTGVCSQKITINVENNTIENIKVIGGCQGNLTGICCLLKGRNIDEAILKLKGIKCGYKETSCPDQIAHALIDYKNKRS